ncbi:MAG: AraC family transcriptional regulator [Leucothrix sp.]
MSSDVLSDVLRNLRATGTVYFCDELMPPWEKHYTGETGASFHQVRRGGCRLVSDNHVEHLGPGDLVFLAPGRAHVLSSEPVIQEAASDSASTLLLCGYCTFDQTLGTPFAALFPDIIIIRAEQLQLLGWLQAILDQLSFEYLSMRPGTEIVVQRMTEVLLVELIRMNFGQEGDVPLIKALADKYISQALQRLHQNIEKAWSLELLAADIGLSRAAFAKRFKMLVGETMFEYLTQLRMQQACQLLAETDLPLYEIANRVGYESDLAFTRTFKKRYKKTPTAYRKQL